MIITSIVLFEDGGLLLLSFLLITDPQTNILNVTINYKTYKLDYKQFKLIVLVISTKILITLSFDPRFKE